MRGGVVLRLIPSCPNTDAAVDGRQPPPPNGAGGDTSEVDRRCEWNGRPDYMIERWWNASSGAGPYRNLNWRLISSPSRPGRSVGKEGEQASAGTSPDSAACVFSSRHLTSLLFIPSHQPPHPPATIWYYYLGNQADTIKMLGSKDLIPIMNHRLKEVTEVLDVPPSAAAALMRENKWAKERLFETFYNDPDELLKSCGVLARSRNNNNDGDKKPAAAAAAPTAAPPAPPRSSRRRSAASATTRMASAPTRCSAWPAATSSAATAGGASSTWP